MHSIYKSHHSNGRRRDICWYSIARHSKSVEGVSIVPNGSYSLAEASRCRTMLRLTCPACGRRGHYRVERLLERYRPDIALPDLRHELAQCPRRGSMAEP